MEAFVKAGLQLGWQMEMLLCSPSTVAHLEAEASLEIRCIPDMQVPLPPPWKNLCWVLLCPPATILFSLPFPCQTFWMKNGATHHPISSTPPPALQLPPTALQKALRAWRGYWGTTHFQIQWHFLSLHPLDLPPASDAVHLHLFLPWFCDPTLCDPCSFDGALWWCPPWLCPASLFSLCCAPAPLTTISVKKYLKGFSEKRTW